MQHHEGGEWNNENLFRAKHENTDNEIKDSDQASTKLVRSSGPGCQVRSSSGEGVKRHNVNKYRHRESFI